MSIYDIIKDCNIGVLAGPSIPADYTHDECAGLTGSPDVAVEAYTTEDVAKVLSLCTKQTHLLPCAARAPVSPAALCR